MKINSITPGNMLESYKGNQINRTQSSQQTGTVDRVELSEGAQNFASVIADVKDSLETRSPEEKKHIDQVASQIRNGTYKVDSSKIAEKMLGHIFDETV
ncbi:flagellar biosynthesis anti-sigma factor FlgM [Papillibacter cinnamivorans]|uniref:Negative regulator of flagellin synthesis n=1 Tax=Papillibacter cinnamivorans DSM 12816 TaxID=1122930 RepID=A0A1W1YHA6_9FIRM|nr:flagellar biosynthesis anti-sigma factor FlgM [Papillibacter cinnamivorans]SMC35523.1 anti-sigma-28 factor, FlgM family [Papillibacter cinnamivorans DSM 12816]